MTHAPRPTAMFPPGASTGASTRQPKNYLAASQPQSSSLVARISSKKAELENLRQLRDLSGALAAQMQALEDKLSTLNNGTEAVACVLANWDNVLQAISMASQKVVPSKGATDERSSTKKDHAQADASLPATLVRIPVEQPQKSYG
ncbi:hypothetical protein VTN02DRAFT_2661 [Thermoascus thermophilus]